MSLGCKGYWIVATLISSRLLWASVELQTDRVRVYLDTAVSHSQAQIAEPIQVSWTIHAPEGSTVVLPTFGDRLGEFEVIKTQDILDLPADNGNQRTWKRRATLESLTAGELVVPSIECQVIIEGVSQLVRSQEIPFKVTSLLEDRADPTQFRDIRSVIDAEWTQKSTSLKWIGWSVGGAGLMIIVGAVWVALKRRRRQIAPVVWVRHQLAALMRDFQTSIEDLSPLANRLDDILRSYLAMQLDLPASSLTTPQLIAVMQQQQLLPVHLIERFNNLLESLDLNQFAQLQWTRPELLQALERSQQIVEEATLASSSRTTTMTSNRETV
jgi:hypothetical protein